MKRCMVKNEISVGRAVYATGLALLAGWLVLGCGKASTPVPADCQAFLDKYFQAVKSKDMATLQSLSSAFWNWGSQGMPGADTAQSREVQSQMIVDNYKRMNERFGDFQNYTVTSVKVTKIPQDRPASESFRQGTHAEIECTGNFSKQSSMRIGLHLFKETPGSDYSLLLWNYQAE